jgi:hypothetical protein
MLFVKKWQKKEKAQDIAMQVAYGKANHLRKGLNS